MPQIKEFKDPDYDRRLAEFKARRDQAKKEMGMSPPPAPMRPSSIVPSTQGRPNPSIPASREPIVPVRKDPLRKGFQFK